MVTWHITRGRGGGTLFEVGGTQRIFRFTSMDRDTAEQAGDLAHGDWLMDGKWLAFHRSRGSFGLAFGERYWLWQRERTEQRGDGFEPCSDEDSRRKFAAFLAQCPIAAQVPNEAEPPAAA